MFYIDNISSADLGIMLENENFKSRASISYDEIEIEGKDGIGLIPKNFENVEGDIVVYMTLDNEDYILPLFTGKHTIRIDDRETDIFFYESLDLFSYSQKNAFETHFLRSPFWRKHNDTYTLVTSSVTNLGNVKSKPLIKLKGIANTTVDLTIAGIRFKYHFDEDNEVIVDCDQQEETYNGISKSKNIEIGFEYPILQVGSNDVAIHAGTCEIYVMRKDAWL